MPNSIFNQITNFRQLRIDITKGFLLGAILLAGLWANAASVSKNKNQTQDMLIKLAPGFSAKMFAESLEENFQTSSNNNIEALDDQWLRIQSSEDKLELFQNNAAVEYIQPNYKIHLLEDYRSHDPLRRVAIARYANKISKTVGAFARPAPPKQDNPAVPNAPQIRTGTDPDLAKQWGMIDIGAADAWKVTMGNPDMIVAVIDTGVDYTHEDLLPNLWRNTKEIPDNGIDDDHNGYVDDVIGWDFAANDNKPYDLAVDQFQLLTGGGNPGHGTHCAGNVAARGNNSVGIAGVAPNVKIMALRFISEKGEGTTAAAIKAIRYAVDNGAKITSNSWGSEGEDPAAGEENRALREAIQYAQDKGTLFIAAAGNGHRGTGYDNDRDSAPAYPASYDHDSIVSVAALDSNDHLGSFSNWGLKSVDIGAPGVNVYSTTVGNQYSDKVIDVGGVEVTWDGTSMATPHVAGAAALYWSLHPEKNWQDVKAAILGSAKKIPALQGKSVSGGKLDVSSLIKY